MTMRQSLLTNAEFGSRIAEDEVDELHFYFVETEQWRKIMAGDVDIVFGAKGSGKSALYSLLLAEKEKFRLGRRTIFLAAENPRGTPAFRDLVTAPPLAEENFRALWKLYFLSIASNYMRHQLEGSRVTNSSASIVIEALADQGLIAPNVSLITRLKAVLEYLRKHSPTLEGAVKDPSSGVEFTGKITLSEPTAEQRSLGYRSLDELLSLLDQAYKQLQITAWLVLDRLDVAFSDSEGLEGNALRSLFRTYLDMLSLSNIHLKIFLRDDIWRKIVGDGFREASHVTRTLTLSWDGQSLLNLIIRRLLSNDKICDHYGIRRDEVLANAQLQKDFFARVFPPQIDIGQRQPKAFDWMLSRTADSSGRTAPRELIHLLLVARDEQLKLYELGNDDPELERLFDKASFRSALPTVSQVRYEQTLCAENPTFKPFLDKLEREKTQQSNESLAVLWECSVEQVTPIAQKLVEAGFFERRGAKDSPTYWVPFLYRDALGLVQGAA
jgi:hypothetical protein